MVAFQLPETSAAEAEIASMAMSIKSHFIGATPEAERMRAGARVSEAIASKIAVTLT
jgi:hypothetical protein